MRFMVFLRFFVWWTSDPEARVCTVSDFLSLTYTPLSFLWPQLFVLRRAHMIIDRFPPKSCELWQAS